MKKQENFDPHFDHDTTTGQVCYGDMNYLMQNGILFSNAEYDKISKKYVPDPQPIDLFGIYCAQIEGLLLELVPILESAMPIIDELDRVSQKARDLDEEKTKQYNSVRGSVTQWKLKFKELESQVEALRMEAGERVKDEKTKQ